MALLSLEALHHGGPLLTLAVVLLAGLSFGSVARRLGLPGITGQILAGLLLGHAGLDLFDAESLEDLVPLTHFALGLMAVTVGAHLNLRRLRGAGRRLFILLLFEATVTPLFVFGAVWGLAGEEPGLSALFATCAIATAPATVVAVVAESRAKGVFVKTLVAAVALNNMACIFLFEVARAFAGATSRGGGLNEALSGPARQLLIAIGIGGLLAVAMELVARHLKRERVHTAAILCLVLASGTASFLGVSPLLACLFLGFVQTNITHTRETLVDSVFDEFQPAILAAFFTLAGMHLSFEHAALAGLLAVLVFCFRALGKITAGTLAMNLGHATEKVRKNLGIALLPQAGVAVALVILIQEDPAFRDVAEIFSAVILTVVTVNEIVGPIALRHALRRSGEAGHGPRAADRLPAGGEHPHGLQRGHEAGGHRAPGGPAHLVAPHARRRPARAPRVGAAAREPGLHLPGRRAGGAARGSCPRDNPWSA